MVSGHDKSPTVCIVLFLIITLFCILIGIGFKSIISPRYSHIGIVRTKLECIYKPLKKDLHIQFGGQYLPQYSNVHHMSY